MASNVPPAFSQQQQLESFDRARPAAEPQRGDDGVKLADVKLAVRDVVVDETGGDAGLAAERSTPVTATPGG